jgi:hypothetical protein
MRIAHACTGQVSTALAIVGAGAALVCMIVAIGAGDRLRSNNVSLLSAKKPVMSALSVAHTLEGFSVPKGTSLKAAQVLTSFESLCGGAAAGGMTKGEMDRIRQRADNK